MTFLQAVWAPLSPCFSVSVVHIHLNLAREQEITVVRLFSSAMEKTGVSICPTVGLNNGSHIMVCAKVAFQGSSLQLN